MAEGLERVLYSFMWACRPTLSTCGHTLMSFARLHGSTQYNTLRVCQNLVPTYAAGFSGRCRSDFLSML